MNNLLEWTRIQTGMIRVSAIHLLQELIQDVVELEQINAQRKGILINLNVPSSLNVWADPDMIHTVLRNLLSNALKYTNKEGKINITDFVNSEKQEIVLTVEDNGMGMTKETINQIFRIDLKTSQPGIYNEQGTGLDCM